MDTSREDINAVRAEGDSKQLRWTKTMDQFLIEFLVEEAKQGYKVDKSFKKSSFNRVAKEVSQKFKLVCNVENVENRLKTIRKNYKELKKIENNNSGMSWDDTQKMWKCSENVYKDYIRAHPRVVQYLNKPIFMYDEMRIVCGDDQATESFSKSSGDDICDTEEITEIDPEDITPPINSTQARVPNSTAFTCVRKHGKRVRSMDEYSEKIDKLAEKIGEVANAIKSTNIQDHTAYLYSEVMKSEGFNELILESAFDYLNENDKIARSFLVKNPGGRQRWLQKFQSEADMAWRSYEYV